MEGSTASASYCSVPEFRRLATQDFVSWVQQIVSSDIADVAKALEILRLALLFNLDRVGQEISSSRSPARPARSASPRASRKAAASRQGTASRQASGAKASRSPSQSPRPSRSASPVERDISGMRRRPQSPGPKSTASKLAERRDMFTGHTFAHTGQMRRPIAGQCACAIEEGSAVVEHADNISEVSSNSVDTERLPEAGNLQVLVRPPQDKQMSPTARVAFQIPGQALKQTARISSKRSGTSSAPVPGVRPGPPLDCGRFQADDRRFLGRKLAGKELSEVAKGRAASRCL